MSNVQNLPVSVIEALEKFFSSKSTQSETSVDLFSNANNEVDLFANANTTTDLFSNAAPVPVNLFSNAPAVEDEDYDEDYDDYDEDYDVEEEYSCVYDDDGDDEVSLDTIRNNLSIVADQLDSAGLYTLSDIIEHVSDLIQ